MSKPHKPEGPLHPIAEAVAAFVGGDPVWSGKNSRPIAETRALLKANQPPANPQPVAHVEDIEVPVGDARIKARVYRPSDSPVALIVWAHGGGFVLGDLDGSDSFCRVLANKTGAAVVSLDYRLAPEARFPIPVIDVVAATHWIAAQRQTLAGGEVPMLIGGDSAGGNLAAVASRKIVKAGGPNPLVGQILVYPCTDDSDAESIRRFESPFLSADEMVWFFDQYDPFKAARNDPDFAPLKATDVSGLPPALLITAEHDPLTEQAEAYGDKLAAAGVEVSRKRYAGMIHGFCTMEAFFDDAAGQAIDEMATFVGRVAKGKVAA